MGFRPFRRDGDTDAVLIIGLGRFGYSVARSLVAMGQEVLAVDNDPAVVQRYADDLTHVVEADPRDPEALAQLGVGSFSKAVIGGASDIETSVLTAMGLVEAGVTDIWAKAASKEHGKILARIGVHHVVYPETSMGEQVAHMIVGGMSQYLEFDDDFAIARTLAPEEQWDKTFLETGLRAKYGVTVVGVKRIGQDFEYARPETLVHPQDELVVSGPTKAVERFCSLAHHH
ncbi:MAG TPA: TrkA family potassium uptake protein [Dermatophilaceae bacterium]|nr:TrkA family potassium uptake protein [Dermatophilaceae bacterium]